MLLPLLLALASSSLVDTLRLAGAEIAAARDERPAHPLATASDAGLRVSELLRAEETVRTEVERGAFPGAALAVGRWDRTVVERGFGRVRWGAGADVDPDRTVYDLASLTKVVATTTAAMLLVEDGKLDLDAPVSRYLPAFSGGRKDGVTIRSLLTHTSGLPAWADLGTGHPDRVLARAVGMHLETVPGQRAAYSDIGFVVLYAAAERAAGEPLHRLLDRRVFGPLGMRNTMYLPGTWCERCAPTHQRRDGTELRGAVHDPIATQLGGITGNAGLFSTVHDLSRFAAMLANGGEVDGVRVLRSATIRQFTRRQPGASTRALGWDTPRPNGDGAAGLHISPTAFGHTGFTGTSMWIDPERGTWVILLSNRTYAPRARNQIQALRRSVNDWVASAVDSDADAEPEDRQE